jgi:hypothetical protein
MKKIINSLLLIALSYTATAQDEITLLRMSNTNAGSTARALSVGGAQGSIGADFSATTVNPAGLARYSKSEFCITPSIRNKRINTNYNGTSSYDLNSKTGLNNISLVATRNNRNRKSIRQRALTTSFGIGVNKLADFNNSYTYKGEGVKSSIANFYVNQLNNQGGVSAIVNQTASPQAYLAWQTYLIDTVNGKLVSNMGATTNQSKSITESGSMNETNISLASNYNDKLYIGASLGVPYMRYNKTNIYSEEGALKSLATETLSSDAIGINFKVGAIALPHTNVRLGLAYHSPSAFSMSEKWTYDLSVTNGNTISDQLPSAPFNYSITTPGKFVASAAYLFKKKGFITADVDFINYKRARLEFPGPQFANLQDRVNNVAKATFSNTMNVRIGAEYRLNEQFFARAGYNRQAAPAQAQFGFDGTTNNLGAGIGYRGQSFFMDVAYVNSSTKYKEYNYIITGVSTPVADMDRNANHIVFSMGWRMR